MTIHQAYTLYYIFIVITYHTWHAGAQYGPRITRNTTKKLESIVEEDTICLPPHHDNANEDENGDEVSYPVCVPRSIFENLSLDE